MAPTALSAEAKSQIQAALDGVTGSTNLGIPGIVFCAVDKTGNVLTEQCSGKRGVGTAATSQIPMSPDTTFAIYSCTKMITAIACMQLAEQGLASLDDPKWLYKVAPEIEAKQVLQSDGKLVPRQGDITLRMLLTHTAGFGYSFFNERVRDLGQPTGFDEFSGDIHDVILQPLVNQPGTRWEYGVNIDWAGIVVERVSGLKLDAYFKKNIFQPLGITKITFHPDQKMREHLAAQQQRVGGSSEVYESTVLLRRAVSMAGTEADQAKIFNSGGAGCFGTPSEYCKIIAALLNDGKSAQTGASILKPETVAEMFKNQIPQFPDYARTPIPAARPTLTNPLPQLYPQEGDPPQGWGLSFMITEAAGATGRGRNTGWWAGISNLFWWCDREKGVGGMIASQILPFGDPNVLGAWITCEKAVYDGLGA